MNMIKISAVAAEKIIRQLQRYLIEEENLNVFISESNMAEIETLIDYLYKKIDQL